MKNSIIILLLATLLSVGCKKNEHQHNDDGNTDPVNFRKNILKDFATNVSENNYLDLANATTQLYNSILTLKNNPTDAQLAICKNNWKTARQYWERSEAYLFGPVSSMEIDPRIDTWPVDFVRLDSIMSSSAVIDQSYINNSEESLKGFHPIEYLLFGNHNNKTAAQFTARQFEYLTALAENLKLLTNDLHNAWTTTGGKYGDSLSNANNQAFPTQLAAFEQIANSMIEICDEVANGKMDDVLTQLDSTLEESPFADNSITDFKNNITGVREVYLGIGSKTDGAGLEDFVRNHNLSLDASIKQKLDAAINSFDNITVPFGMAIHTQPLQVQTSINAILALQKELEDNLIPLIQTYAK